jgi:hypothetical protein
LTCIFFSSFAQLQVKLVFEDATGHVKIFRFGGVAEKILRRTAAELIEESSTNQLLLPAALRALVGHSYVFQVVISDHTFKTGQLCFLARRVFAAPTIARTLPLTGADPGGSSCAENLVHRKDSTSPHKEPTNPMSCGSEIAMLHDGESTPPPEAHHLLKLMQILPQKVQEQRGKRLLWLLMKSMEHGYTFVP